MLLLLSPSVNFVSLFCTILLFPQRKATEHFFSPSQLNIRNRRWKTRYKPEVTVTIHFFFFKKRSCLLSTCNLIHFHSILPKYFLFCFVFIFANDYQFSCVDRWRPEETSLESRNKAFCDCSTLAWSPLSVARENGKAEEKSTRGTTDPPLLYLRALTFTRESQDFVLKDPNRYEDVPNISPKMFPIECRSSQENNNLP